MTHGGRGGYGRPTNRSYVSCPRRRWVARRGSRRSKTLCPTLSDADAAAQRMLDDLGGGELLIYDPDLRLRTVTRSTAAANRSGDQ